MNSIEDPMELSKLVTVDLYRISDNGDVSELLKIDRKWWETLTTIRTIVSQETGIPSDHIDFIFEGKKLRLSLSLYELKVVNNYIKLFCYIGSHAAGTESWIQIVSTVAIMSSFRDALYDVRNAFSAGIKPELALYGTGGTYFLNDRNKWNLLVFKPEDEEPFAEHNPRNFQGVTGQSGFRKGIRSGEGWKREVAAYLIDRHHLFAVPTTVQAHVCHPFFTQQHPKMKFKVGSLQEFIQDADLASDWSPSKFSVFEVQKIAFLDMYLMNTDRNDANILIRRKRSVTAGDNFLLIPIDHGYSLPDRFELNEWSWCWLDWKQMKLPWDERIVAFDWLNEITHSFVKEMDVLLDVRLLNESLGIRKVCLLLFRISGTVLKLGIAAGLTPHQIAEIYIRKDSLPNTPSVLEKMVQECVEKMHVYELKLKMMKSKEIMMRKSLSTRGMVKEGVAESQLRYLSSQSIADVSYSKDPYKFPEDVEFNLIHNQEYRHLFFRTLEENVSFWISSTLHRTVYDAAIFL